MSSAPEFVLGSDVRSLSFEGSPTDELLGPEGLTLEVLAGDAGSAETLARWTADRIRQRANLPDAELTVAWVAPLKNEDASSQRFLSQARELLEGEHYELAAVAAQIHFEVQVLTMLEQAAAASGSQWAKRLLRVRGVAGLNTEFSKATVELLLGVDLTQVPEWPRFREHLERRNAIVHRGSAVDRDAAAASVVVVQALWIRLAHAARRAEGVEGTLA